MSLADLIYWFVGLLQVVFPLIVGGIVLVMVYGLSKFIFSLGDTKSYERGREIVTTGLVALFVTLTFWGIVSILLNTLRGIG